MDANRLHEATSPYLQQHADNPVAWWPWCDEALAQAREQDKPILLSIGYSACHWCHVMAHESFEDPETAAVMNRLFVNIKVDREERPDLDKIYQTAYQLLARRAGGWPLTVFLMPDDHSPFFAGTYFPPEPRHGLPAFRDLLTQVERAYREQRGAIEEQNTAVRDALLELDTPTPGGAPDVGPMREACGSLAQQYDDIDGGFGDAPKFPHPATLRFLLRHGTREQDDSARHMALHTLRRMAEGGINDHIGGGFCRYSVDAQWMIPHFEKMLYDNGQLLAMYAEAWALDERRPLFKHACERIAEWVLRDMQSPHGGYYASLDADSEGIEGKFYVWSPTEVAEHLGDDERRAFAMRFGLDRPANFDGNWHLHIYADTARIAERMGLEPRAVRRLLASARNKLFAVREGRVRPGRDEKVLTSWNALMARGMTRAGRLLDRADWIDSAERALRFLHQHHWQGGHLLATSRDGRAQLDAYLDDHAFLLDALLEHLQSRWQDDLLGFACAVADRMLAGFEDPNDGGFFFTANDHERLIHRPRPLADEAVPNGNAAAIEALLNLALLTGKVTYREAAEKALHTAWLAVEDSPTSHVGLLEAAHGFIDPPEQWIIRGDRHEILPWRKKASTPYQTDRQIYAIPAGAVGLAPGLADKAPRADGVVAYRCLGTHCEAPITEIATL